MKYKNFPCQNHLESVISKDSQQHDFLKLLHSKWMQSFPKKQSHAVKQTWVGILIPVDMP